MGVAGPVTNRLGQISADQYRAQEITGDGLTTLVDKIGGTNISSLVHATSSAYLWSESDVHQLSAFMLAIEAGERFAVGDHDMIALRFICDDKPYTLVAVEGRKPTRPVLVDGHITDRKDAIKAWLGDTDPSDHPDLFLD